MKIFSEHKIALSEIIREIPEEEFIRLSNESKEDYPTKVLAGKLMLYLLTYGMLKVDRLSQSDLQDVFSSQIFRNLFKYKGKKRNSHNSISDRLSAINVDFCRNSYEIIYQQFESLYTKKEIEEMYLERIDNTIALETTNKLLESLNCKNEHIKKNMSKSTINFDGTFGSLTEVHKETNYSSECIALPENVVKHFKKLKNHSSVYLINREQCSADAFQPMKNEDELLFIGRLLENRKLKLIKENSIESEKFNQGILLKDFLVQLYQYDSQKRRSILVEETYRVIRFRPNDGKEDLLLITNILHLSAREIAEIYCKRRSLEVFFCFLKQELNFSHFLSLSENGIQVLLYMTLITVMQVMIYKKENELGYQTAVRRMEIELESLIMAVIVIQSGGDLKKTELPNP